MKQAIIQSTGSYLPARSMSNAEIEQLVDTSHEWIYERTGISSRHIANPDETTAMMAAKAAQIAIDRAGLDPNSLDLIILATCTPDCFFPSTACYVKDMLGITRTIPAFDVSAACSGFVYIMDIAKHYIASGGAKHILLIGSERMSETVDWQDRSTCVLFGDGAGAMILTAVDDCTATESDKAQMSARQSGIIATKIHSAFDKHGILLYPKLDVSSRSSNTAQHHVDENLTQAQVGKKSLIGKIKMKGNDVFKLAVTMMGEIVDEILTDSNIDKSDIDWLIPHQANIRIIKAIAKKIQLPMSRVIITVENQGNTSAASIPIALDNAIVQQQIKRGDLLLIEAFGGGITWGAALVRY